MDDGRDSGQRARGARWAAGQGRPDASIDELVLRCAKERLITGVEFGCQQHKIVFPVGAVGWSWACTASGRSCGTWKISSPLMTSNAAVYKQPSRHADVPTPWRRRQPRREPIRRRAAAVRAPCP
jgi:hypothetical protein